MTTTPPSPTPPDAALRRTPRARIAAAVRRLPAAADAYTLQAFNPQLELRARR